MNESEIRALFKTHDVDLTKSDVWAVQSTPVIKHAALERLSAKLGLTWDMPREVMASMTEVVILARATRKDGISEWSYGECNVVRDGAIGGNYRITGKQAGYPFAMAEKRAKDRVIIKLAGLHGAYSEEEADDFNRRNADASDQRSAPDASSVAHANLPSPEAVKKAAETKKSDNVVPMKKAEAQVVDGVAVDGDGVVQEDPAEDPFVTELRAKLAATTEIKAVTDLMGAETLGKLKAIGTKDLEAMRAYATERLKALGWMSRKAQAE